MASDRMLRWLCWGLIVAAVVAALSQLVLTLGLWAGGPAQAPAGSDLVTSLLVDRTNDQNTFGIGLLGNVGGLASFLLIGLIAVLLRGWAAAGSGRDVMATMLVIAAVVGIASQLIQMATAQMGTGTYCDCGFKNEEVISQGYALNYAVLLGGWFTEAAFLLVGIGFALVARFVTVTGNWRVLTNLIAIIAIFAIALRFVGRAGFYGGDIGDTIFYWTDIVTGLTIGILVPIWAFLLMRGSGGAMERSA